MGTSARVEVGTALGLPAWGSGEHGQPRAAGDYPPYTNRYWLRLLPQIVMTSTLGICGATKGRDIC